MGTRTWGTGLIMRHQRQLCFDKKVRCDSHDDLMVIVVGLIAMELHQHVSE